MPAGWFRRDVTIGDTAGDARVTGVPAQLSVSVPGGVASGTVVAARGALTVGAATYPIPTSGTVVYVASTGSDTAAGTAAAPWATVQHAVSALLAASGGTVIVRAGTYHESFQTANTANTVTIQPYPGEAVWFDGSTATTGWSQSGSTWVHTGITTQFARNSGKGWSPLTGDVLSGDPYADLSDQVFLDGTPLTQVADGATPAAGQFSVSYTANTITIGSDPTGHEVRVSDLRNLIIATSVVNLKGVGVQRYSPDYTAAVTSPLQWAGNSAGSLLENVYVTQSAMVGATMNVHGCTVRNCTVENVTYSGMFSYQGDGLTVDSCVFNHVNTGLFAPQPQASGVKITECVGPTVTNCEVREDTARSSATMNDGIWTDVTCIQVTIARNSIVGYINCGICYEESDGGNVNGIQYRSVIAGNYINGARFGIYCQAAGNADVYNNTISNANQIYVQVWKDRQNNVNNLYLPESECPFNCLNVTIANNILGSSTTAIPSIRSNDTYSTQTANQLNTQILNNAFLDTLGGDKIQWGNASQSWISYGTVAAAQSAQPGFISGNGDSTMTDADALAMPATVAAALQVPTGTKKLGAYLTS